MLNVWEHRLRNMSQKECFTSTSADKASCSEQRMHSVDWEDRRLNWDLRLPQSSQNMCMTQLTHTKGIISEACGRTRNRNLPALLCNRLASVALRAGTGLDPNPDLCFHGNNVDLGRTCVMLSGTWPFYVGLYVRHPASQKRQCRQYKILQHHDC